MIRYGTIIWIKKKDTGFVIKTQVKRGRTEKTFISKFGVQ